MSAFTCIVFDIEGILIQESIWPKINALAGISAEIDSLWYSEYYRGAISFNEWIQRLTRAHHLAGKTRSDYETIMTRAIRFEQNVEQFIQSLQQSYLVCLASSTVDIFVQEVACRLSISEYNANYSFVYDGKNKIKEIKYIDEEAQAKASYIKSLCKKYNFQHEQVVIVGDSSNDMEAFRLTGRGILVGKGNEKLENVAWKQVENLKDIENILFMSPTKK